MKVSVVVCVYTQERWDDIVAGYDSLLRQTVQADEVIIVVDHNDLLLHRAIAAFPQAVVLPSTGAPGLSGARNTGVAAAAGDIVLFLDDDAAASPSWVERMSAVFDDPYVVGVGGWAEPRWDSPGRPRWFPEPFLWVVGCSYEGLPSTTSRVRNPIGCTMGFRRSALIDAGGFSSAVGRVGKHPVGCEETELSIRVQQQDGDRYVMHEPRAVVHHRVNAERLTRTYFARRCFWEGYSKAVVSTHVGSRDALAAESAYVRKTLPVAFVRGLTRLVRNGSVSDASQSLALVVGLFATGLGYLRGRVEAAGSRPGSAAGSTTGETRAAA